MDTRNLVSEKNENSEESRNSVRFPDSFTINYNIVTQKEYDKKAPLYISQRTANRSGAKSSEVEAFLLTGSI